MQKKKIYDYTRFTVEVLRDATTQFKSLGSDKKSNFKYLTLSVQHEDSEWEYDLLEEFLADYRIHQKSSSLHLSRDNNSMIFHAFSDYTSITVQGQSRSEIESIFSIFEASREACRIPVSKRIVPAPIIFIGHGRNEQWKELKDHLQEKHGYKMEAYETGARAGHTIRDILEDMITKSSFAVLVLTAEDEQSNGEYRARQNVIHEAGLFQGRLGFPRAIMLIEEGVESFSNVHGIQYIEFSKGNIKETYGEVLATLRREFPR